MSEPAPAPPVPAFAALGLRPELLRALAALGYEEPTPIQREAIPPLLAGRDVLGQAATGTGKTAAFALPILHHLPEQPEHAAPHALVLVPTRELAVQVSEALYKYGHELGAQVVPVYGGQPIHRQLQALQRGAHVVVATPGRAIDLVERGALELGELSTVVLDEADEMLDMGFADDIEQLLSRTPPGRQTVLFSATMPARIDVIASRHQSNPTRITIAAPTSTGDKVLVRQTAYVVGRAHKPAALGRILDVESPSSALVFCRTRGEVDQLTETLNGRGYRAEALHGGMDQAQRDRVLGRMRAGTAELLVATDVAARGLDLDLLTHVVNYDVPSAPESYVHRIGRVGRAGREGVAITLAEPREQRLLANIERLTGQTIAVAPVPSVAELRARQAEAMLETLRAAIERDDDTRFGAVVDALAAEHDLRDIAVAAVRLAHDATVGTAETQEIPAPAPRPARAPDERPKRASGQPAGRRATLYVNLGRAARVTPGDLVGAICNETNLAGRDVGPIKVAERFSLVGVPEEAVDEVIAAIARTTIRGRSARARRYTDAPAARARTR